MGEVSLSHNFIFLKKIFIGKIRGELTVAALFVIRAFVY